MIFLPYINLVLYGCFEVSILFPMTLTPFGQNKKKRTITTRITSRNYALRILLKQKPKSRFYGKKRKDIMFL
nr:MAG TPA: protein of unknown function (DUF1890) [Bacteriophage sp.]